MTTEDKVIEALGKVLDPELYISLTDLGLIYNVSETDGNVKIAMTLTSLGCPLFSTIEKEIRSELSSIKEIKNLDIEVVFDPPWNVDKMSERGRAILGI